jgi:hypothetical protein
MKPTTLETDMNIRMNAKATASLTQAKKLRSSVKCTRDCACFHCGRLNAVDVKRLLLAGFAGAFGAQCVAAASIAAKRSWISVQKLNECNGIKRDALIARVDRG